MRFRKSAPVLIISAVVVVITAISVVSNLISRRMVTSFEEGQFALMGQIMQAKLTSAEAQAIASAEILGSSPAVKKAFAEQNREELLALTHDTFQIQSEKYGISQGQFHLAPATSFLRVHNPKKFGEDQSSYRKIVMEVNQARSIRKGVEITTSGIGIFGTLPMSDESGKATGSFEMGLEFGPLLDQLKKDYGFEIGLFIDEKQLKETATSLKGDILSEQNRVGPNALFYSTHPQLIRALVQDADMETKEDGNEIRSANGVPYGVLLQPIYNYAKKQIGVVAVAKDFRATRAADRQAAIWQSLAGVLSVVLLIGVVVTVIRGMLLQPLAVLNARMEALAKGTEAPEGLERGIYCEEMRTLAANCEKLAGKEGQP